MSGEPVVLGVTGGSAGVAATYADALRLADTFDETGDRLREWGARGLRVMRDPDLLESGLLSPVTCAAAETAVLAATAGRHGALAATLGWELDALAVRAAITCLEEADEAVRSTVDRVAVGVLTASPPLAVATAVGALSLGRDLATERPGLVQAAVNGLGGRLATGVLAVLYGGPGAAHVTPYGGQLPASTTQPGSVRDLVEHLREVAGLSPGSDSEGNGTVEVQTITGADGQVRHILYLPGTDDFNAPWDQDGDVRDLETDLDLMAGHTDAYQEGIVVALAQAGVRPDQPVLVVGHSQGGMEAVALLSGGDSGYHVTDVVTAGAPTAQVGGFPHGTHVLSLEQQGDVVPQLDGAPNPDSVEQTTITFDAHPAPGVVAHHAYGPYVEGAGLADGSTHPSVAEAVQSLHDHGFLGDGSHAQVSSQLFQITRSP